jgi:hypothetical protein
MEYMTFGRTELRERHPGSVKAEDIVRSYNNLKEYLGRYGRDVTDRVIGTNHSAADITGNFNEERMVYVYDMCFVYNALEADSGQPIHAAEAAGFSEKKIRRLIDNGIKGYSLVGWPDWEEAEHNVLERLIKSDWCHTALLAESSPKQVRENRTLWSFLPKFS